MKHSSVFRTSPRASVWRSSAWRASVLSALALTAAVQWPLARPASAQGQMPGMRVGTPVLSPVDSVNPLVGSAEHGHTYPGATVPFGMVQISPDTRTESWDGSSGYHYSDSTILGFSHAHLSGTGVGGLGDVMLMPTVGAPSAREADYKSPFSHDQEKASPGYYSVYLQKPGVQVELSATAHCGIQRYVFPASQQSNIVVDLAHGIGNSVIDSALTVESNTVLSGTRISNGWGGRRPVYFVMEFSKPFNTLSLQGADGTTDNAAVNARAGGRDVKAVATFTTTAKEAIVVKVGISATSVEGARKNLAAEMTNLSFSDVQNRAVAQWNTALGKIEVQTPDPAIRRTFYSNLYLSYLSPVLFNDADGSYRGTDRRVHTNPGFQNYTTFSLWDTFRAEHPLLTLVQPQRVPDMVNSMLAHYNEFDQHSLPVWSLWGNETWTMIGYHSAPVIADAYLKGFTGFNAEAVYQALKDTATQDRNGLKEMTTYGYVTSSGGGQKQSVSRTLEYAYDDWCVGQMALKLGHTEDAEFFFRRAGAYRNLFDSRVGFVRGRKANGDWRKPFNPKQLVWADYTEANAWQYNWSVMQDVPGLINVTGGDKAFTDKLEEMFNEKSDVIANIPDITGLIGQYAHGNEPVHHAAYLYSYAGAPYMTQRRVRQILSTLYNDTPAGQPGNNDCGQMSAWYVFSALGFYPVNPAGGEYVIGSPIVNRATLHLEGGPYKGTAFTVIADNNSAQNIYVQTATLNGQPLTRTYLTQADLVAGGTLRLVMGPQPNMAWGKDAASRPHSGMPAGYQYAKLPAPSTTAANMLALPIRIVAGSDDPVAGFVPDENMMEGQTNGANVNVDTTAPDAGPPEIYKSERYGDDFAYKIPVPKGKEYTVRLHFAEIFDDAPGARVENVHINGKQVLTNFDAAAEAGQRKAVVKTFKGIMPDADGNIVVRISAAPGSPDQNAKISGLEILAQ